MNAQNTTHIERLRLTNFRCFEHLEIEFDPELTVLVADNGGGKTTVLEALAIALCPLGDTLLASKDSRPLTNADIRLVLTDQGMVAASPTAIRAYAEVRGQATAWEVGTNRLLYELNESALVARGEALRDDLIAHADKKRSGPPPVLPVLAYYGTGRDWAARQRRDGARRKDDDIRTVTSAYMHALSGSPRVEHFVTWFDRATRQVQNEIQTGILSPQRPRLLLDAVQRAISAVLEPTGWQHLEWDFLADEVIAFHPEHGRLPVAQLSDGIRATIALVADLAHRAVRLNPQFGEDACFRAPGIVLVDEVDKHLHPSWQQIIVGQLRAAFPAMQFILTTHSPQVLSTVRAQSVRSLRAVDGVATTPAFQTRGVESADVLGRVMGVDPTPAVEEAGWLSAYRGLIEDGKSETPEADALRKRLLEHFGPQHPAMIDCNRLARFQALKLRRATSDKV